jgi:tetratricopeptide (TPR) repeat protein
MRTLVLAALVLLPLVPPAPQQAGQIPLAYRALVDAYRSNGSAEVEQAGNATQEAMEAAVNAARSADSGWTWEELRGAAMLHSEVALRALQSHDVRAADVHLQLAQRLLDRTVSLSPAQEDFAWRWYMVMPPTIGRFGGRELAKRLEEYASAKWSRNLARQAFFRGLTLERRGAREPRIAAPGESMASTGAKLRGIWLAAATHFAEALREDSSLRAAALHLGRLRMLHGQRVEAATLFRSALGDSNPAVAYLAALFLGSLEERDERYDAAEALYRRAVARIPHGQSAWLALAEVLSRTGREREAREALAAHVLRQGALLIEPLWAYGPPGEDPAVQIDLLRMEVWK